MEWKYHFREIILGRGQAYFYEGRVNVKSLEPSRITAEVRGSKNYSVEVQIANERIAGIYCSCPHAAADNFCKHMAAVLYKYEDHLEEIERQKLNEYAVELVQEADDTAVRVFLLKTLQEDHGLLKLFIASLGEPISADELDRYREQIDEIFDLYLDSDDYTDYDDDFHEYDDAWDFHDHVIEFMETIIEKLMLNHGYLKEAFELTFDIFIHLVELPIDDFARIRNHIAVTCVDIWERIIEQADAKLRLEMFVLFKTTLELRELDDYDDYLEHIIFDVFDDDEFNEPKKSLISSKLSSSKADDKSSLRDYYIEKWAVHYMNLLTDEAEMKSFYEEYIAYPSIRTFYAEHLVAQKAIKEAIQVLEDGKEREEALNHYTMKANELLKNLYLEIGEKELYLKEMYTLITFYGYDRKDLIEEYKGHFSEEDWQDELQRVIENISLNKGLDDLLRQEKRLKQLLEVILTSQGMNMVDKHGDVLYEKYPNLILDKYEQEILELSKEASGRNIYRQIAALFRKMSNLENSEERVGSLLNHLRTEYKNRPAMMEELEGLV